MHDRWHKLAGPTILLLAFFHGGLYASLLPPWSMIDETQHFHYIQHLAEQYATPVVGQTHISLEIVESLFETRHWETFHWPTPNSHIPQDLGFIGHSYEGYQPPLYYALFAPLLGVMPGNVLVKLYFLRWATVGLSLLTVWIAWRTTLELFPEKRALAYSVGLFLALLPERVASISRVNNDVLLEVLAAAFIWVCTRAVLQGLTLRRSLLLGLLLGLGALTKTSMAILAVLLPPLFWVNRRISNWLYCALGTGGIALVLIAPLLIRNLSLYGDPTGFSGFKALDVIPAPPLTGQTLFSSAWDLFRHYWVLWWKGATVRSNLLLDVFYVLLVILGGFSLAGLVRYIRQRCKSGTDNRRCWIAAMYALAIGSYAAAVLVSYYQGYVPVIQGRFLLPVVVPTSLLFMWGLWHTPYSRILVPVTLLALIALDVLSLFGNLLPYFYYWSAFATGGVPQSYLPSWQWAWGIFYSRFLSDKPVLFQPVLILTPLLYVATLVLAGKVFIQMNATYNRHSVMIDSQSGS